MWICVPCLRRTASTPTGFPHRPPLEARGGLFAWQALTDELEERYGLAADPALTDPANWDTRVLEHFFLGSQGKRVGSLYAGADDITLYTPKFDSELTYSCPAYGFTRIGPFETSVCFPERVARQDWFNGNPYTYYAGGDYPIATITNHKIRTGRGWCCCGTPLPAPSPPSWPCPARS